MNLFKKAAGSLVLVAVIFTTASQVYAHCEIPCGIYGDNTRFDVIAEHITTIEKSMNKIDALGQPGSNMNQLVRWVQNKESHADAIREIVTQYFLAQRIKFADPKDEAAHAKYEKHLGLLHRLIVHCMKAKQTTDLAHVAALRESLEAFRLSYLGKEAADHLKKHHGK